MHSSGGSHSGDTNAWQGGGPISELSTVKTLVQLGRICGGGEGGSDGVAVLRDALNRGEPKGGLEMSLRKWGEVCAAAADGPWLSARPWGGGWRCQKCI